MSWFLWISGRDFWLPKFFEPLSKSFLQATAKFAALRRQHRSKDLLVESSTPMEASLPCGRRVGRKGLSHHRILSYDLKMRRRYVYLVESKVGCFRCISLQLRLTAEHFSLRDSRSAKLESNFQLITISPYCTFALNKSALNWANTMTAEITATIIHDVAIKI